MPEAPEVLHAQKYLTDRLLQSTVLKIEIMKGPYLYRSEGKYISFRRDLEKFTPIKIKKISRKGKLLFLIFDKSDNHFHSLSIHMGMDGFFSDNREGNSVLRIQYNNSTEHTLYFNDIRKYGTLNFLSTNDYVQKVASLGPDVYHIVFRGDWKVLSSTLTKNKCLDKMICSVLLDQSVISGIGNYLRSELLYLSCIKPSRLCKDLTDCDFQIMFRKLKELIVKMYRYHKSTSENKSHAKGYPYSVYSQSVSPNGNKVQVITHQKRKIWWVPEEQL